MKVFIESSFQLCIIIFQKKIRFIRLLDFDKINFIKKKYIIVFRERIGKLPRSSANRISKFFETLKINHIY